MTSNSERRRSKRRPILSTFSFFVVVPKKGVHRLQIFDVSESGVGFELDTEGESQETFPAVPGDSIDIRLYLNQSLFLPLTVQITRVDENRTTRKIGAEFPDKMSKSYRAFHTFIQMLDSIVDIAEIENQPPV